VATSSPISGSASSETAGEAAGPSPAGRSAWMDIDWRRHSRWVVINDTPVNVVELGKGPAVVFVHGLSGSWPNWLEQLPFFARTYRAIAIDLPGFGWSPLPPWPISIPAYADLLDGLLDALAIPSATLVGSSMGGQTSAEFAASLPRRVDRLVLVSPSGLSTFRGPGDGARALPRLRLATRLAGHAVTWGAANADLVARRPRSRTIALSFAVHRPALLYPAVAAEQIRGGAKPGFFQALDALLNHELRPRLPSIAAPTLIVWGDRDRVVTPRDAPRFAELIPDARTVVYPDIAHLAMLERPDEFNALLASFLAE
jgi:pimeloyl-ACP methyl ester carboxylesterase